MSISSTEGEPNARKSALDWMRIILLSACAGVLAFGLSFFFRPKYESYATYYFPMTSQGSSLLAVAGAPSGDAGVVSNLGGALTSPVVGSAPQTAIGILSSRACRQRVIELTTAEGVSSPVLNDKDLDDATDARLDRNGLLRLSVTTESPEVAQKIVQSYQTAFEEIAQNLTLNVSKKNRQLIEARLKKLKNDADTTSRELLTALSRPGAVNAELAKSSIEETERQLIAARQLRAATKAKVRGLMESLIKFYDSGEVVSNPGDTNASPLMTALQNRQLEFEDTRKAFMPSSPEYQRSEEVYLNASKLVRQLANRKAELAKAGIDPQTIVAASDYSAQLAAERELEKQLSATRRRAKKTATDETTIDGLTARSEQLNKTIAQLESEYQLAVIAEARDPSRFEILDKPEIDLKPVFPRRILIAALAFAIAFAALGIRNGLAWVRKQEAES